MKNNTLVFTATFNESENIKNFLDKTLDVKNIDILIVDDNSPDGTAKIIKDFQKNYQNIKLIVRNGKEGLDTAHKLAYKYAKEEGYTNLITMDADLSHDPSILPLIVDNLDLHPFVLGSRYIKGGKCLMKGRRLLLSWFGNKLIRIISGINSREFTTSYRGFNLDKLKGFSLNDIKSKGYSFFMETIYQINKLGYKIYEIPIIFATRKQGKSKIPKIEIFRTLLNVFRLYFEKK